MTGDRHLESGCRLTLAKMPADAACFLPFAPLSPLPPASRSLSRADLDCRPKRFLMADVFWATVGLAAEARGRTGAMIWRKSLIFRVSVLVGVFLLAACFFPFA